jgi:glycosyltransferase involved in cell wall biosynthesis
MSRTTTGKKENAAMRIVVHDYVGYAYPIELSVELAKRGHEVTHLYAGSFQAPKGISILNQKEAPDNFKIEAIHLSKPFQKYSFVKRRFQEVEYGKLVAARLGELQADVVISANTPIESQSSIVKACQSTNSKFIFWVQDVYSVAAHKLLRKRIPIMGELVGQYYMWLERRLLRQSDDIVLITEDFQTLMDEWKIPAKKRHVIPNWAPLEEMPVLPKANEWAQEHGVADKICFLYSGTLGLKHNPDLLLQLAINLQNNPNAQVIVVSEGLGGEWLRNKKNELGVHNLKVLGFQPFEQLPNVLASADILVAILEPDAGVFSVPSKVLTYLCAKRPLLLAVPPENLAARIVSQNEAGLVVPPSEMDAFIQAAKTLLNNPQLREKYAANGRAYAERHFNIQSIADKFESVILR